MEQPWRGLRRREGGLWLKQEDVPGERGASALSRGAWEAQRAQAKVRGTFPRQARCCPAWGPGRRRGAQPRHLAAERGWGLRLQPRCGCGARGPWGSLWRGLRAQEVAEDPAQGSPCRGKPLGWQGQRPPGPPSRDDLWQQKPMPTAPHHARVCGTRNSPGREGVEVSPRLPSISTRVV